MGRGAGGGFVAAAAAAAAVAAVVVVVSSHGEMRVQTGTRPMLVSDALCVTRRGQ